MFKKIMSFMLAVMMIMSVAVMATSAAQVEIADNSADAIAEVAADGAADTGADAGADTGAANVLNFDANTAGWNNYKKVFCHIWAYGGDAFYAWQSKAEACTDAEKDGVWTYDLDKKGVTLEAGVLYACIFSNENGMQTYDLLMDSTCIGDTAYCDLANSFENPEDSSKTATATFWTGKDPETFGPVKCVTSIGNVVGTCVPSTTSAQAMFVDFLVSKLENARTYAKNEDGSAKNDQQIIDDTAAALGLLKGNVEEALYTAGVTVDWSADKSTLDDGVDEDAKVDGEGNKNDGSDNQNAKPGQGTIDKKPASAEDNDKDDSSNGGSSNTGSSNTGSSNKTGSGSTTKTGQETTVLFVMVAIMMAAAGVVVISRKRENA